MIILSNCNKLKLQFCILIWLIFPQVVKSQDLATFSILQKNKPLLVILKDIETKCDVRFSYKNFSIDNKKISVILKNKSLDFILEYLSDKTNLVFNKIDKRHYTIVKRKILLNTTQYLDQIVVTKYLTSGISKKSAGFFTVKPKKIGILAGLTEADVFESLQQLPSIVSVDETATNIHVRGGNSDQNRIIFDGINIYHKGHLFGMISPFNPNIIDKITFYNKGTNPRYGERISSVIILDTNSKIHERTQLNLGLNGINFDVNTSIPIVKNKLQIQTSFRRSFTELIKTPTFNNLTDKVFQTTKVIDSDKNSFNFTDYTFKMNYHPNKNNKFYVSSIYINNNLNFINNDVIDNIAYQDAMNISNFGLSGKWIKNWSSVLQQNTILSFSNYHLLYTQTSVKDEILETFTAFDKRNRIYDTNFITELDLKISKKQNLFFGYEYNFKNVSYAFLQTENQNAFVLDSKKNLSNTHSVFGNYNYSNTNFSIQFGTRFNYYKEFDQIKIEPRLVLNQKIFKNFKIQATAEIKNQRIKEIDETVLSDFPLENRLWQLSDSEDNPIINSKQFSIGAVYHKKNWTIDADFYLKNVENLTALSLGYLNPNDPNFHLGNQHILGMEFYTKKEIKSLSIWLSYTLNNIKSRYENVNDYKYFTSSNAIRHNATISTAYKKDKLEIALAWNIRSGKTYTLASFDANNNFVFNRINSEFLPIYHRLDFSSTYAFKFSKKNNTNAKIGFSIRNIYNQKNQLSKEYIGNNSLNTSVRMVDKFGLGFTPNILFRVWF